MDLMELKLVHVLLPSLGVPELMNEMSAFLLHWIDLFEPFHLSNVIKEDALLVFVRLCGGNGVSTLHLHTPFKLLLVLVPGHSS